MSGSEQPNTAPTVTPPPKGVNVRRQTREKTVNDIDSFLKHYENLQLAQDVYENIINLLDHADVAFGIFTMGIGSKIYSLIKLCYDKSTETIREAAEEKVITGMLRLLAYGAPAGSTEDVVKEATAFRVDVLQLIFNGNPARILELRGRIIKTKPPEGSLIDRLVHDDGFIQLARLVEAGVTLSTTTAHTGDAGAGTNISIESYIDSISPGWLDKMVDLGDDSTWTRREYLQALTKGLQRGQLPKLTSNMLPPPFFPARLAEPAGHAVAAPIQPVDEPYAAGKRVRTKERRNATAHHPVFDADTPEESVLRKQDQSAVTFAYDIEPTQPPVHRALPVIRVQSMDPDATKTASRLRHGYVT